MDLLAENFYASNETKVSPITENSLAMKLWRVETNSYEITNGEKSLTIRLIEILNSNAIPIFYSVDIDDYQIEAWLTDLSVLQPESCSTERSY